MFLSAHGMGHAVRAAAVLSRVAQLVPLQLSVVAACEARVWPEALRARTVDWRLAPLDAGVVQSDDVTVDDAATRARLDEWLRRLPAIVEAEAARLGQGVDLVVGDVPSPAFAAAKRAGIRSVAIANFSWDWIYAELGFQAAAEASAAGFAEASLLLEATPSAPMPAFARREVVGLVARPPSRARVETRAALGAAAGDTVGLVAFQAASAPSVVLPPPRPGRLWLVPTGWGRGSGRSDVRELPPSVRFEDALAAADVVVGKPGYGLIGDVEAAGVPFLFVPRPGFPENAVLVDHLGRRPATQELSARALADGRWEDEFEHLASSARPLPADLAGTERAARAIAAALGGADLNGRDEPGQGRVDSGPVRD